MTIKVDVEACNASSTLIFDPVGEDASGCQPGMRLNLSIKIPLHQLVDALMCFHRDRAGCDVLGLGPEPPKGVAVASCDDIGFGPETMPPLPSAGFLHAPRLSNSSTDGYAPSTSSAGNSIPSGLPCLDVDGPTVPLADGLQHPPVGLIVGCKHLASTIADDSPPSPVIAGPLFVSVNGGDEGRWAAMAEGRDGRLYAPPCNSSRVLRIDPSTGTADLIGPDFGVDKNKWRSIAASADGRLYAPPYNASRVLRIDPRTGNTDLIGEELEAGESEQGQGVVVSANGRLYSWP